MIFNLSQRLFLLVALLTFGYNLTAQQASYNTTNDKAEITIIPQLDRLALADEDALDKQSGAPIRAAILYPLNVNTDNAGIWEEQSDGSLKTWILTIKTPESFGSIVRYSDFYIPQGGKLYVYSKDYPNNTTVYTHENNGQGGPYSTEVPQGSQITLEYVGLSKSESPRLQIVEVGYKYRQLSESMWDANDKTKRFNDPLNNCMINVNCEDGNNWQDQKKGVVHITTKIGSQLYYCSGSLVNNTNKDKTPYILSACHCYSKGETLADFDTAEYWFGYEFAGCENELLPPTPNKIIGATPLVLNPINGGSDGALLRLSKNIDTDWDVYFNGWNIESRDNVVTSGSVIHHPQGDTKKITLYSIPLRTASWSAGGETSTPNAHWTITYSKGVTEGGSSGGPIFDQNGLIVGTLTGGSSTCANPNNSDYYAKFAYNWNKSSNADLWMQKYLDPNNTNVTQLVGWNGLASEIVLSTQNIDLDIMENKTINILSGNGEYTVTSSNPTIADAKIENDSEINIVGVNEGNVMLTVEDKTGNKVSVAVTVNSIIADSTAPSIYAWWKNTGTDNNRILTVRAKDETNILKKIRVINLYGNDIKKITGLTGYSYDIDTFGWPKGVYVLMVDAEKASRKIKIIK